MTGSRVLATRILLAAAPVLVSLAVAANADAGYYMVSSCSYYGNTAPVFVPGGNAAHLTPGDACMVWNGHYYRSLEINEQNGPVLHRYGAQWSTTTPSPAIVIVNAYTPVNTILVDCRLSSDGFTAQYFWAGGTQSINYINGCNSTGTGGAGLGYADGIDHPMASRYFGWTVGCWLASSCSALGAGDSDGALVGVYGVQLEAEENSGPALDAIPGNNLYHFGGDWVRGSFPTSLAASDPSGVCAIVISVNGQSPSGWNWADPSQDGSQWTQCHNLKTGQLSSSNELDQALDTTQYPNGAALTLGYAASNAAKVVSAAAATVHVDNAPVTLSLSGPSRASSEAGTQYVTAIAAAGPSGDQISCSVNGGANATYNGTTGQIPVSGVGEHEVVCQAHNFALSSAGAVAYSPQARWSIDIGQPTLSVVSFAKVADPLRCNLVRERVKVPAQWVTVMRHHKPVRVRRPAHTRLVQVERCHPRMVWRRVTVLVTVRRHGKAEAVKRTRWEHVALPPHVVSRSTRRVAYGQGTTVNGWLGLANGTPLAGQAVSVIAAPDNGQGHFRQAAVTTTAPNGTWTAALRPGPSRLVQALYGGSSTLLPASSAPVHLIVPARVRLLRIWPARVPWGGTIHIAGQLAGGYLPAGGALVRLRIGFGSAYTTYGVQEHVTGNGRFTTTYTFGVGDPSVYRAYWFQLASLPMGNYPFAPASSGRRTVLVGG